MRKALKVILYGLIGLAALTIISFAVMYLIYPAEYMRRTLTYLESDVYDYQKFPARTLNAPADPFLFTIADDPAAAEAAVRAAFESDDVVGDDLEAFLEATRTQAFIVIHNDTILYEDYFTGAERDSIVTSFSVAKSFGSALVGIAIEEGYIASIDDPITDYLPELAARDPQFEAITIRHLLNMTSGIRYTEFKLPPADDALTYYFPDLRWLALNQTKITGSPGETWHYNNYHPLLIGMILERATGMSVSAYLEDKIWQPLGMEYDGSWSLDSEESGFEKMESGINARAIDFAKFGRLYLHGGEWEGQQIVPAEWVEMSTQMDNTIDRSSYYPPDMSGSGIQIYHQMLWWGIQQDDGDYGFAALGNHGQMIFVWPSKQLIIVRHGERYGIDGWLGLLARAADRFDAP